MKGKSSIKNIELLFPMVNKDALSQARVIVAYAPLSADAVLADVKRPASIGRSPTVGDTPPRLARPSANEARGKVSVLPASLRLGLRSRPHPPPPGGVSARLRAKPRISAPATHPFLSPTAGRADRARRVDDLSRHLALALPAKLHLWLRLGDGNSRFYRASAGR